MDIFDNSICRTLHFDLGDMISFLFDVFFEIAKILSFILADTINDGKRTVAMIGDAIGRLDVGFAKASIFEILVIALILTL